MNQPKLAITNAEAQRVLRGGPLNGFVNYLDTWQRNSWDPYTVVDGPGEVGIRCARTP